MRHLHRMGGRKHRSCEEEGHLRSPFRKLRNPYQYTSICNTDPRSQSTGFRQDPHHRKRRLFARGLQSIRISVKDHRSGIPSLPVASYLTAPFRRPPSPRPSLFRRNRQGFPFGSFLLLDRESMRLWMSAIIYPRRRESHPYNLFLRGFLPLGEPTSRGRT